MTDPQESLMKVLNFSQFFAGSTNSRMHRPMKHWELWFFYRLLWLWTVTRTCRTNLHVRHPVAKAAWTLKQNRRFNLTTQPLPWTLNEKSTIKNADVDIENAVGKFSDICLLDRYFMLGTSGRQIKEYNKKPKPNIE